MTITRIVFSDADLILKQKINKVENKNPKVGFRPENTWQQYSGVLSKQGINQSVLDDFAAVDKVMWK